MISLKKIYYVPGLISALLIPLLFWYYITPYIDFTVTNVIDVELITKDKNANPVKNYIGAYVPTKHDYYRKINIKSNEAKENSNLYVSEIRKLKNKNSENKGIEFVLNENNTYGDFVSLLNDFHISKHEYYGIDPETGNIVVSTAYENPTDEQEYAECLLCNDHIIDEDAYQQIHFNQIFPIFNPYYFQNQLDILTKLPKPAYVIFFAFLIFLNISMFSIKERFLSYRTRKIRV